MSFKINMQPVAFLSRVLMLAILAFSVVGQMKSWPPIGVLPLWLLPLLVGALLFLLPQGTVTRFSLMAFACGVAVFQIASLATESNCGCFGDRVSALFESIIAATFLFCSATYLIVTRRVTVSVSSPGHVKNRLATGVMAAVVFLLLLQIGGSSFDTTSSRSRLEKSASHENSEIIESVGGYEGAGVASGVTETAHERDTRVAVLGRISGKVLYESGSPCPGARVWLDRLDRPLEQEYECMTDASGSFSLNVPPGHYQAAAVAAAACMHPLTRKGVETGQSDITFIMRALFMANVRLIDSESGLPLLSPSEMDIEVAIAGARLPADPLLELRETMLPPREPRSASLRARTIHVVRLVNPEHQAMMEAGRDITITFRASGHLIDVLRVDSNRALGGAVNLTVYAKASRGFLPVRVEGRYEDGRSLSGALFISLKGKGGDQIRFGSVSLVEPGIMYLRPGTWEATAKPSVIASTVSVFQVDEVGGNNAIITLRRGGDIGVSVFKDGIMRPFRNLRVARVGSRGGSDELLMGPTWWRTSSPLELHDLVPAEYSVRLEDIFGVAHERIVSVRANEMTIVTFQERAK